MEKIEHIGIAVRSLESSVPLFETLLQTPCYKTEYVADEGVNTAFFRQGDTKIELLEATEADNALGKFIGNRGEGLHHIAFEVKDIVAEMERLRSAGFVLLQDEPRRGADNKWICFLHPKSANGVLIELCQAMATEM